MQQERICVWWSYCDMGIGKMHSLRHLYQHITQGL